MHTLAEPRDNKEIFPPKGNLHLSSYKRLGPGTICTGISETQAMLSQIELKDQYEPIIPHRALHKMKKLIEEVYVSIITYIIYNISYNHYIYYIYYIHSYITYITSIKKYFILYSCI